MLIEVFSLQLQNMSNQHFSISIGHSDETAMETIGVGWVGDGIDTQHFEMRSNEHVPGKKQGAGKNFAHLKDLIKCDADTAAANVDGSLDERSLSRVALRLKTDG